MYIYITNMHTYTYIHTYIFTYTFIHPQAAAGGHVYTHNKHEIYVYIYIFTYTYTRVYTQGPPPLDMGAGGWGDLSGSGDGLWGWGCLPPLGWYCPMTGKNSQSQLATPFTIWNDCGNGFWEILGCFPPLGWYCPMTGKNSQKSARYSIYYMKWLWPWLLRNFGLSLSAGLVLSHNFLKSQLAAWFMGWLRWVGSMKIVGLFCKRAL